MSRWGFVVSAVRNKLSTTKATYCARVQHMDVLRGDELYKELAQYLATNPTRAEGFVKELGGFIEEKLKKGYKLDFGIFKVGLTLRGGFDSANDDFKPGRNCVCASFSSGVRLKKAVSELCPRNLTNMEGPVLHSVYCLKEGAQQSVIVCHEPCGANGVFPNVGFKGDGDGVWLETMEGIRVADAKILSADGTRIDFVFEKDVPSGKYRFVVGFHEDDGVSIVTDELPVMVCFSRPIPNV